MRNAPGSKIVWTTDFYDYGDYPDLIILFIYIYSCKNTKKFLPTEPTYDKMNYVSERIIENYICIRAFERGNIAKAGIAFFLKRGDFSGCSNDA